MREFNNSFSDYSLNFIRSLGQEITSQILINVIVPAFFRDELANLAQDVIQIATPSSDYNSLFSEQTSSIVWGRHGNDSLIGFDPAAPDKKRSQIDIIFGDFVDEEFYELFDLVDEASDRTPRNWQDRFILGDWRQPYYIDSPSVIFGLNQFAVLADFSPQQDLIQLHGTAEDYQIRELPLGTGIFWQQDNHFDLVAFLPEVASTSLSDRAFKFVGDTPPSDPVVEEIRQIGTVGIDLALGSTVDAAGNVYVGGGTTGTLGETNLGSRDAWLTKYDPDGNQLWTKQFGTTEVESVWALANDGTNVYVVGDTSGNLGGSNRGGRDIYLAKFDSDGNQIWIRQLGSSSLEQTFGVTTDSSGNVYVSAQSLGDIGGRNNNVGQNLGSTQAQQSTVVRTTDSFVTKFDSDGNQQWLEKFGTSELDDFYNIAIDNDGNVFAGGPTTSNFEGEDAGLYDSWLVKLDNDGALEWLEQFGTDDYEFLWDIDTDSKGNVYATGWTLGDLGGENAGSYDSWVAKYNGDGEQQWIRQFGTSGDDGSGFVFGGIEVDSNDNIFLTGSTDGDLGGENAGSYDAWVAKYDGEGSQQWIRQFGTPDYDVGGTVSSDGAGNLYVTGFTEGSLGKINAGAIDGWIAKLDAESGTFKNFSGDSDAPLQDDLNEIGDRANLLGIEDERPPITDVLTSLTTGIAPLATDFNFGAEIANV